MSKTKTKKPVAKFEVHQLVVVHSSAYGDWAARVEDRYQQSNGTWRYEVSDSAISVLHRTGQARCQNVPEEILEPFSSSLVASPKDIHFIKGQCGLPPTAPMHFDGHQMIYATPVPDDSQGDGLSGDALLNYLRDQVVEAWHESVWPDKEIWEALGMTKDEYGHWVENPKGE